MFVFSRDRSAVGHEAITVSTVAVGFTPTEIIPDSGLYKGMTAKSVFATCETANIRFCIDGTTATTSVGHILIAGNNLTLNNESDIKNFSAIRDDAVDATLMVTYRF